MLFLILLKELLHGLAEGDRISEKESRILTLQAT
jgi:hypothetical protein